MNLREQVMQKAGQPPSGLLEVVSLQQFDGSWKLKDAAQLTSVSLDALSANNPAKVCHCCITVL